MKRKIGCCTACEESVKKAHVLPKEFEQVEEWVAKCKEDEEKKEECLSFLAKIETKYMHYSLGYKGEVGSVEYLRRKLSEAYQELQDLKDFYNAQRKRLLDLTPGQVRMILPRDVYPTVLSEEQIEKIGYSIEGFIACHSPSSI